MSNNTTEQWTPICITIDPLVLVAFLVGLGVSVLAMLSTLPPETSLKIQDPSAGYSEFYEVVPAKHTSERSYATS